MKKIKTYYPEKINIGSDGGYKVMNNDEKYKSALNILNKTIDSTDEYILNLLYQGYGRDIDKLFDEIIREVYYILYGRDTYSRIQPTIRYLKEMENGVRVEMMKANSTYFCSEMLGMQINWHHIEWGWLVENFLLIAVLAARDHGKSFFFSHGIPLWKMYRYDRLSQDVNILNCRSGYIFSNTQTQAVDLLEIIRDSITDIDELRESLYPNSRDNWSKGSIKTKNGCKLRVRGLGATVRGGHPGYMILDDVLKDNVIYSKHQRERNKDYFNGSLFPMLIPGGQMLAVGTPFHVDDLYSLFRSNVDFAYREYPAIDEKGNLLWKERHSKADLDMRRRVQGNTVFTREYLVKPISAQSTVFPDSILKRSTMGMQGFSYVNNIEAFPMKFRKVITGCDFAMSSSVGADSTSFVTFGIDDSENFWLLNIYHKQGVKYFEQRRALYEIWRKFKPDVMFLEANQFQDIYSQILKEESSMPIKPFVTSSRKQSLTDGVPGLAILFENGKIRFPYATKYDQEVTEKILNEFRNIGWTDRGIQGVGEHDDIVMSIWLARMAYLFNSNKFIFELIGDDDGLLR